MGRKGSSAPANGKGLGNTGLQNSKKSGPSEHVKLSDGTKVPVALPPGMDPAVGAQVIEYLRNNPEMAAQSLDQAQRMMAQPGMAHQMLGLQSAAAKATPEQKEKMSALKSDPELKLIFDDIEQNGPGVMEKYWNDKELMGKISSKMSQISLHPNKTSSPSKATTKLKIESLQDAAKAGDIEAARKLLDGGADIDGKDKRGITPLGVAVGFNKISFVEMLLEKGVNVETCDPKGNTALHYAAGYGRKEVADLLIKHGARLDVRNVDKQTPAGVAQLNRETHMVAFLAECSEKLGGAKFL